MLIVLSKYLRFLLSCTNLVAIFTATLPFMYHITDMTKISIIILPTTSTGVFVAGSSVPVGSPVPGAWVPGS